jgi:peroxiredoxin
VKLFFNGNLGGCDGMFQVWLCVGAGTFLTQSLSRTIFPVATCGRLIVFQREATEGEAGEMRLAAQVFCENENDELTAGQVQMALTESTMRMALGDPAPSFSLPDTVSGKTITLDTYTGAKALLVMFICNHCPYVRHVDQELARLGIDYQGKPLGIVAISSNDDDSYPDDGPAELKKNAARLGYVFPYCHDKTQAVAQAFHAACTPDFFLFDEHRKLVYRGQLDDSRPGNGKPVTGRDLRAAIDAVLAGEPVDRNQRPSAGCNIKWKRGNQPKY